MINLGPDEISELLNQNSNLIERLKTRSECCVIDGTGARLRILNGKTAKQFVNDRIKNDDLTDIAELRGQVACIGSAKGVVKIINKTLEMKKMNQGDILVSLITAPEIVPAMKKAAGIVTDVGGLTSHAAIVSRELNVPCIIGTKIATKIFKDGDLVEVDADNGVVRKIN